MSRLCVHSNSCCTVACRHYCMCTHDMHNNLARMFIVIVILI